MVVFSLSALLFKMKCTVWRRCFIWRSLSLVWIFCCRN